MKIQQKWKSHRSVTQARIDTFMTSWAKYCCMMMEEEKHKPKKPNSDLLQKIPE